MGASRRGAAHHGPERFPRTAPVTHRRLRRALTVLTVAALPLSLAACSSPLDVSEAERAAEATCEILRPLAGVAGADCSVDDGGFDAGISRDTTVEMDSEATAEQAHRVISAWLSSKDGGFDEYEVSGSRATPLHLTVATVADASFSIAPGSPATGVAFVDEWLSHARDGMPISASVGDGRTLRVADDEMSPSEQADLLDEFAMQTRTDRLTLSLGEDSTIESPTPAALGDILRGFTPAYLDFAESDPEHELEFRVDVFTGGPPRLWVRIPTGMAPPLDEDSALTEAPGWAAIRSVLGAAAPGGDVYSVTVTALPGQVLGRFSTSGCDPQLPGPESQFGDELQAQWAAVHGVVPVDTCP